MLLILTMISLPVHFVQLYMIIRIYSNSRPGTSCLKTLLFLGIILRLPNPLYLLVCCILHRLKTVAGMGKVEIGLCLGYHICTVDNSHLIHTLI